MILRGIRLVGSRSSKRLVWLLTGLLLSFPAHALPLTFDFSGTVRNIPLNVTGTTIALDDPIHGSYTYDPETAFAGDIRIWTPNLGQCRK